MATTESKDNGKQEPSVSREVVDAINAALELGSKKLDLSKKSIEKIPDELTHFMKLEFLYLEGNSLKSLPDGLFSNFPNLKWLDLRNNNLSKLPASIGELRSLRSLLLENNNLKNLPLELGFAKSLSGLHLAGNPLEYPPTNITEQGTQTIIAFLRDEWLRKNQICDDVDLSEMRDALQTVASNNPSSRSTSGEERARKTPRTHTPPSPLRLPSLSDSLSLTMNNNSKKNDRKGQNSKLFASVDKHDSLPAPGSKETVRLGTRKTKRLTEKGKVVKKQENGTESETSSNKELVKETLSKDKTIRLQKRTLGKGSKKEKQAKGNSNAKNVMKAKITKTGAIDLKYEDKMSEEASERRTSEERATQCNNEIKNLIMEEKEESKQHPENEGNTAVNQDTNKVDVSGLEINEMVVIKVAEKHFIPGQPCLGKIVSLPDANGDLLVHYYSGSYDGEWRPMMSRSSPYLRRIATSRIICKFKLNKDNTMSAETVERVTEAVKNNPG